MRHGHIEHGGVAIWGEPVPSIDSRHRITEGAFYWDTPDDGIPARAPIRRLPLLSNQGTAHPDRSFLVRARDGYALAVKAVLRAPTIGVVFEAAKSIFTDTRFRHIEVRTVR